MAEENDKYVEWGSDDFKKPEIKIEPSEEKVEVAERVEAKEPKSDKPKFKIETIMPKKPVSWKTTALIAIILLIISLAAFGWAMARGGATGASISSDKAGELAKGYVSTQLINPSSNVDVSVNSVQDEKQYYLVSLNLKSDTNEQEVSVYITKDGKQIFLGADDLEDSYDTTATGATEIAAVEMPKTAKPTVDLYVMSFCPFGTQAETGMAPVFELLKDSADFNVHYIVTVSGTDMSGVDSLHGPAEAAQNARQLCILDQYDKTTLWKYLSAFATAYSGSKITTSNEETAWKDIAKTAGVDAAKIDNCYKTDAFKLTEADAKFADDVGASGSPTLIINGQDYAGARTPEAYKTAICSAFTEAPSECDEVLSGAATTAAGNC